MTREKASSHAGKFTRGAQGGTVRVMSRYQTIISGVMMSKVDAREGRRAYCGGGGGSECRFGVRKSVF